MQTVSRVGPLRFGLIYAALYLGTGATTPYLPTWFRSIGLSGLEIGIVLAAPMLARPLTGHGIAMWADRLHTRRAAPALLAVLAGAALALLLAIDAFASQFILVRVGSVERDA